INGTQSRIGLPHSKTSRSHARAIRRDSPADTNLIHFISFCDCVYACESGLFGTSSPQSGSSFGGLDLELCVSVLSQRWTVFAENRGPSVFVRTFLAFGTSTASWPRNEKRHSKNMTVNARTKLST